VDTARRELASWPENQASLKGQKGFRLGDPVEIQRARRRLAGARREEGRRSGGADAIARPRGLDGQASRHARSILPAREQLADLSPRWGSRMPPRAVPGFASVRAGASQQLQRRAQVAERAGKKEDAKVFRDRLVALCGGPCGRAKGGDDKAERAAYHRNDSV